MGFLGWNIPVSQAYCNLQKQAVDCTLDANAPLVPNYNIVPKVWWGAFLMTSWSTVVVSFALIGMELKLRIRHAKYRTWESPHHHHDILWRSIHIFERLINAFSEQQSIAGLSLLIVAGHDGCEMSAYIYNLVCFLILMSLISHLNALTNTRNWFSADSGMGRGILNGVFKLLPIITTIIMAGIMLGARNGGHFPVFAGKEATLPAACYENTNIASDLTYVHNMGHKSDWVSKGLIQFLILILDLFVIVGILALALVKKIKHRPAGFREDLSLVLRAISTSATTACLVWLSIDYITMRQAMEGNPEWYQQDSTTNQFSYYNVVTSALFASSCYTIFNSIAELYSNDPRRAEEAAHAMPEHVIKISENFDKATHLTPDF